MFRAVAQMIQFTFQPALDPFHSIFRLLRLRRLFPERAPLHRDHVRILDFYLLFPFRIGSIRFQRQDMHFRSLARRYEQSKPYGEQPEDRIIFNRMEPMQIAALETLSKRELIEPDEWKVAAVAPTATLVPEQLAARIEELNAQEPDLISFLEVLASRYELLGSDGLKARTGLLEYRYDAV